MKKPVYLGLSILDLGKTVMYEFWNDYGRPKYSKKADHIYNGITEDVEIRSDISNYELEKPLPKGKNKKIINLMKDELGGKIIKEFAGLWAKTYCNLIDEVSEDKKAKGIIKYVTKRKLKFEDYKNCLEAAQLENKIKYL